MNGVITIKINGEEVTFRFGMIATEIFSKKALEETLRIENRGNDNDNGTNFKSFAYMVYAGLCNQADFLEIQYPTWADAFTLAEDICADGEQLQTEIFQAFISSRPTVNMLERLNGKLKGQDKKKGQLKKNMSIGKK